MTYQMVTNKFIYLLDATYARPENMSPLELEKRCKELLFILENNND